MIETLALPVLAAASVAAGLVSGVFLTFSDFVMRALGASAPAAGMEAMQQINRTVYRSVFMVFLLGLVPVSLAIGSIALLFAAGPAAQVLIAGAALYIAGVFAVTAAGNVPMNKRLDGMALSEGEAHRYWTTYGRDWTRLNHIRTAASAGTAILYLAGALMIAGQAGASAG